ncbi:MAG: flagellar hook-length control protein FliK [Alphaproteobacteria bacterium]|nr:flagellar hook-length control protein FliK [Alphaproteobacteria bacterium]
MSEIVSALINILPIGKSFSETKSVGEVATAGAFLKELGQVEMSLGETLSMLVAQKMTSGFTEEKSVSSVEGENEVFGESSEEDLNMPLMEDFYVEQPEAIAYPIEAPMMSLPILTVLKSELPCEDFDMYAPRAIEMPVPLKALQVHIPPEVAPVSKEILAVPMVENVIFVPADKIYSEPVAAPQFIEQIQKEIKLTPDVAVSEPVQKLAEVIPTVSQDFHPDEENTDNQPHENFTLNKIETIKKEDVPQEIPTKDKLVPAVTTEAMVLDLPAKEISKVKAVAVPVTNSVKVPQVVRDVAVHMKQAIDLGMDKVTIQVNPPSLGKIHVELKFAQDGRVNAILTMDKIETYDLFKQSPQLLKDALSGSGVDNQQTDVSFSLKGEDGNQEQKAEKKATKSSVGKGPEVDLDEPLSYRASPHLNTTKKVDIHA